MQDTLVRPISSTEVEILGTVVRAANIDVEGRPTIIGEDQYPLYFEVGGHTAWYVIAVFDDRIGVELFDPRTRKIRLDMWFSPSRLEYFLSDLLCDYDPDWAEW